MKDLFDLSGKIAIVTGGAGLLGPEHSKALCSKGAKVILADINEQKCKENVEELKRLNFDIHFHHCDVRSKESWMELLNFTIAEHGLPDILINNAGYTNKSQTSNFSAAFEDFPLEDWNAIIDVNLTGCFLGCQVIGKAMLKRGSGSIINIASLYGVVSPNHRIYPGTGIVQPPAYSISKHGVVALTKYLGALWAKEGIRVNALTPGGIFNDHKGLFLKRFEELNPIGRMSRKDELMGGIIYLASDASSHVVGHNLIIDGGWTAW